ncbi:MAG: hypothetical protein JXR84_04165 [Anaerolineae bacterium]|nr:hypothetical protein [Anaerolineae bacterium]
MAHYTGADLAVTLGGTTLAGIREVTIPEDHPTPDTTHAGNDDGESIPGGITYRNGCTMTLVDDDGGTVWAALAPGTTGTMVVYPLGNTGGKPKITGSVVVTNRTRTVAYNDAVSFQVTFNVSGAWTPGTV